MKTVFLHTADWQLGKPFAGVSDNSKRALLQNERFNAIRRLGEFARERGAGFVVVAGDLFDSSRASKATVSAACSAIGSIGIPVYAIPGNHDHGGAGSIWDQDFFLQEREKLAPNFTALLKPEPIELETAVIFPCPLLRRHEAQDPTSWLRQLQELDSRYGEKSRIVLAHGSIQDFGSSSDDEDSDSGTPNLIDLGRLPSEIFDYVALGDWHGTKHVGGKAWYSGTPELDRFVKGAENDPGNVLLVETSRGKEPKITRIPTGVIGWHEIEFQFVDQGGLERLSMLVDAKVGNRANQDLLRLHLGGSLGIDEARRLDQMIDAWAARLLRVKMDNKTLIEPSASELDALTMRPGDPLISLVASKILSNLAAGGEESLIARIALRELHAACSKQ
ncbi:MAG: DNA repair exonuclease [Opitutaceae bacterium]